MKFKLHENLGSRTADLIGGRGHDVQTISQEKLNGVDDVRLFEICAAESRCSENAERITFGNRARTTRA